MTNNYIRIGFHPRDLQFFFFDSNDARDIQRAVAAAEKAHQEARHAPIAVWRGCPGVPYPTVGSVNRGLLLS